MRRKPTTSGPASSDVGRGVTATRGSEAIANTLAIANRSPERGNRRTGAVRVVAAISADDSRAVVRTYGNIGTNQSGHDVVSVIDLASGQQLRTSTRAAEPPTGRSVARAGGLISSTRGWSR